jgi:hypothetical protein
MMRFLFNADPHHIDRMKPKAALMPARTAKANTRKPRMWSAPFGPTPAEMDSSNCPFFLINQTVVMPVTASRQFVD